MSQGTHMQVAGLLTVAATAKSRVDFAEAATRLSGVPMMHLSASRDSRSTTFIKGQEQKRIGKSAIKADFHDTHTLRSMGFKFSPKQFRYGADDWFGLAKRIDGDIEGKMRVWQVYLAQPPLL